MASICLLFNDHNNPKLALKPDHFSLLCYRSSGQARRVLTGSAINIQYKICQLLTPARMLVTRVGTGVLIRSTQTTPVIAMDASTWIDLDWTKQGYYCSRNGLQTHSNSPFILQPNIENCNNQNGSEENIHG